MIASPVVCSDETSVRVNGKTWWEWVFVGTLAVLHVIRPSRGKAVVTDLFGTLRPEVWVSDMLGSQRGHGRLGRSASRICCAMPATPWMRRYRIQRPVPVLLLRAIAMADDASAEGHYFPAISL